LVLSSFKGEIQLDTKLQRLALMESMGKRLVKLFGGKDKRPLLVGWDYPDSPELCGLPPRDGGYGVISVLERPGKKHVTLAGDRAYVRLIEEAWESSARTGEGTGFSFAPFYLWRVGWEPEWATPADAQAWKPTPVKAGA
jgi:hypothetical protein